MRCGLKLSMLRSCCNNRISGPIACTKTFADLQGSISDAVVHFEELVKATDEEDMNLEQQKKIRAMLERIRKYYRQMDSASEPLSFMRIAEDLLRVMDELAQELDVPLRAVQKLIHYCE